MSSSESKPKVTVIFPTKNESATISQSIAVAKQGKYKPSVIVVDGHSMQTMSQSSVRWASR